MGTSLLDRPEELLKESEVAERFCHVVCCNNNITLCGAYKPNLCGYYILSELTDNVCPACGLMICPECSDLLFKPCQFCEAW